MVRNISMDSLGRWHNCLSCVPFQALVYTQPTHWKGHSEKQRSPWYCSSTVQEYLEHQCVSNTVLVTNPNHTAPYGLLWRKICPSQYTCSHWITFYKPHPGSSPTLPVLFINFCNTQAENTGGKIPSSAKVFLWTGFWLRNSSINLGKKRLVLNIRALMH